MSSFFLDVRYALRSLRRTPGFTAAAVATLALGIGANAAMFSVVDAVLLRPLPFPRPGELVHLSESDRPNDLSTRYSVAPGNFLDWRRRQSSFTGIAAAYASSFNRTGIERPERLLGAAVSWNLFEILGVAPEAGRAFRADEDSPSAHRVVLLSDGLWRRRFGASATVVGSTISLNGEPHTIIGILPPRFEYPERDVELWMPLERQLPVADMRWRGSHYLEVIGRLRPGVSLATARADLNRIAANVRRENSQATVGGGAVLLPLQDYLVRPVRSSLLLLLAAVGLVLAIACANVANLLLVRGAARSREMAIRRALGASPGRIVRQLVTESVLLALAGAAAGASFAGAIPAALVRIAPVELPRLNSIGLDLRVLAATFAVAAGTGVLFGLAPAWIAATRASATGLAGARRGGDAPASGRTRGLLVAAEISLAVLLTLAAGLTLASLRRVETVDAGFPIDRLLTARVSLPAERYRDTRARTAFFDRALPEIRALPGVAAASLATFIPLTGTDFDNSFAIEGRPPRPDGRPDFALFRSVGPDFFHVLRIPILRGRALDERDREDSEPVVVVDEAMARRYWGDADPLDRRLTIFIGENPRPRRVVGIARSVRAQIDAPPQPTMYVPYPQGTMRSMVVVLRASGDARRQIEPLRRAIARVDPDQPIHEIRTLPELLSESVLRWRFATVLFGVFAGLALLLAAIGVYGVVSYSVTRRRREFGIRSALGAEKKDLVRLVLRQGLKPAAMGAAVGFAAAFVTMPALARLLFDTSPRDPAIFGAVAGLLGAIALAACLPPARRAARVDPAVALREE